jgi:Phage capsid family
MNKDRMNALRSSVFKGAIITKEAPPDVKASEALMKPLLDEMGNIVVALKKSKEDSEKQYTELNNHYGGVKATTDELKATVLKHAAEYAETVTKMQMFQQALDQVKKELDAPIIKGGKDLEHSDREAAIELQRRAFMFKGGLPDDFKPDLDNLVEPKHYRSAVRKLMHVGIESKQKILRSFTPEETKAFEASSLDAALFSPEILGFELNCIVECAELLDLYSSVSVSKSLFMYPHVMDYGQIGKYDCDAKCDAEYGPEGNITFKNGKVSDFRGVFCFQRKVLAEANYDLLNFMYNAAARSYRTNRNRATMVGDGVNEPMGWLTNDCFTKRSTKGASFDHIEFRSFHGAVPREYGQLTTVMHQNVFAYLAAMTDANGRFLFGDGLMTYSPDDTRERIRISNCLPDPTANLTLGTPAAPFVTGAFILATGAWKQAYYIVNKRPLWIEQWEGKSTAWCVAYSFGADDGGFVACCPAASILLVGP